MCGCTDLACTQRVSEDMTRWAQDLAGRNSERKMSEADQQRAMDISTRMTECIAKAMPPTPGTP